ncbi:MAG: metallopeptidase family protein [Clostridia bacterium]|jgi:hypothetical protein
MLSIDEMEEMLDEIAMEFPPEIYKELNGGIILLPEAKPNAVSNSLYILGEYHSGGNMGRYISIYYGSFSIIYGHLDKKSVKEFLIKTLKHEFVHHVESLAGEKDLEIKDAQFLENYLKSIGKR